jgi:hypothetical protein
MRPMSITAKGQISRGDDPAAVVRWPRCAQSYAGLRRVGLDLTTIADACAWAYETGVHRSRWAGAGTTRLIREWRRCRKLGPDLYSARLADERSRRDGAGR